MELDNGVCTKMTIPTDVWNIRICSPTLNNRDQDNISYIHKTVGSIFYSQQDNDDLNTSSNGVKK